MYNNLNKNNLFKYFFYICKDEEVHFRNRCCWCGSTDILKLGNIVQCNDCFNIQDFIDLITDLTIPILERNKKGDKNCQ